MPGMPSKVVLFGVGIDPLTREQVLDRIRSALEKREKLLVTHVHVMGMNLAYRTPWLRDFFNSAGIVYCSVSAGALLPP